MGVHPVNGVARVHATVDEVELLQLLERRADESHAVEGHQRLQVPVVAHDGVAVRSGGLNARPEHLALKKREARLQRERREDKALHGARRAGDVVGVVHGRGAPEQRAGRDRGVDGRVEARLGPRLVHGLRQHGRAREGRVRVDLELIADRAGRARLQRVADGENRPPAGRRTGERRDGRRRAKRDGGANGELDRSRERAGGVRDRRARVPEVALAARQRVEHDAGLTVAACRRRLGLHLRGKRRVVRDLEVVHHAAGRVGDDRVRNGQRDGLTEVGNRRPVGG